MTEVEVMIGILISIFSNGITILADREDVKQSQQIERALEQLNNDYSFSHKITKALKDIKVKSKEIDNFKKIMSDDLISERFSAALLDQEDTTLTFIIEEIINCCGIDRKEADPICPIIREFARHFRQSILSDPRYSAFSIVTAIQKDGMQTRREMGEMGKRLEERLEKGFDEISARLNQQNFQLEQSAEAHATTTPYNDKAPFPDVLIEVPVPRTITVLSQHLEDVLGKLDQFFKYEAEEVQAIQKARDYRKATEKYKSLLEKASPEIDKEILQGIYIDCALCSINMDEFEEADSWLSKAEGVNAQDTRVIALRGLLYHELGNNAKAKEYIEKSFARDPFYHISAMLKAIIDLQEGFSGKDIAAARFLDEAGNLKTGYRTKHHAVLYRTVGQCLLRSKEFDEAIKYFHISNSLDSEDDCVLALLGHAYLEKAVSQKAYFTFDRQATGEDKVAIEAAIKYYTQALLVADSHQNLKIHISTYANLSTCYMLLGKYDRAYSIADVSSFRGANAEILLKAKATAAFYSERHEEAYQLLSETEDASCRDVINRALALLQSAPDLALKLVQDALNEKHFNQSETDELRFLKYEILLDQVDLENALPELDILDKSGLDEWEKQIAWGRYFTSIGEDDKATQRFQTALKSGKTPLHVRVNIASYFFNRGEYEECVEICSQIPLQEMNVQSGLFRQLLQISVISLFHTKKLSECRTIIEYSKNTGIKEKYLYEISASMYLQADDLEMARIDLKTLLDIQNQSRAVHTLCNAAMVCCLLGNLNEAEKYYNEAESKDEFYKHSDLVINAIRAYIIIGNTIRAKQILEKTISLQFDNKNDNIHKFALIFYLRENRTTQFVKYALAFNQKHGDVEWLWTKNIEKDKEELQTLFDHNLRKATELKKIYLSDTPSLPLAFMAAFGARSGIVHVWTYNREYGFPIFLEEGDSKKLESEIDNLKHVRSVAIDYTCLLALVDAGDRYLWLLGECFDQIIVYRPVYLQILSELMSEEHAGLRSMLKFLSSSNKVKFLKERAQPKPEPDNQLLPFTLTANIYEGLFAVAKETDSVLIAGEKRIRALADANGVGTCGVRSLLEYAAQKGVLDVDGISEAIVRFAKKDCRFISFNTHTLHWLFSHLPFEEAKTIFKQFSSHLFLGHSIIESFMNVYIQYIAQSITHCSSDLICYVLKETVSDVKKFLTRARIFDKYYWPENWVTYASSKDLNRSCLLYVYRLALIIYSANIDEQLREKYVGVLKKEANLLYWFEFQLHNQSAIHYVFSEAKNKAKDFERLYNTDKTKESQ